MLHSINLCHEEIWLDMGTAIWKPDSGGALRAMLTPNLITNFGVWWKTVLEGNILISNKCLRMMYN